MASSDLWTAIDSQLGEIFMIISEKAFSYDCSWLASTIPSQRKTYMFSIF